MSGSPIIPTLRYKNVVAAIDWLHNAFGFERHLIVHDENNRIAHAQMVYGNGMIMLSEVSDEEQNDLGTIQKPPASIDAPVTHSAYIVVADSDIQQHYARAQQAQAVIVMELTEQEYGGTAYSCRDPEGYLWNFGSYSPWEDA